MIENQSLKTSELSEFETYKNCKIIQDTDRIEFEDIHFESCILDFHNTYKASIVRSNFKTCDFSNLDFEEAYFGTTTFSECKFLNTNIRKSYLNNLSFNHCLMKMFILTDSKVKFCKFKNTDLSDAWLRELELKTISFKDCILTGVDFSGTKLRGIDLRESEFEFITYTPQLLPGLIIRTDQTPSFAVQLGIKVD